MVDSVKPPELGVVGGDVEPVPKELSDKEHQRNLNGERQLAWPELRQGQVEGLQVAKQRDAEEQGQDLRQHHLHAHHEQEIVLDVVPVGVPRSIVANHEL